MQDQPKFIPLRPTTFFDDGRSERPLIEGTVARGHLNDDVALYTGMGPDGKPVDTFPFPITKDVMARGQQRFDVYCAPCHDRTGDGNGMIVQRGFKKPPSYHEARLVKAPIGHFFYVMTNGWGSMADYSSQVPVADRWRIAAYIRALQLSQAATPADLPAGSVAAGKAPQANTAALSDQGALNEKKEAK